MLTVHITGTDATHAEHIETIKSRMYVGLTADQRFTPGELGMGLVEGMCMHARAQCKARSLSYAAYISMCACLCVCVCRL